MKKYFCSKCEIEILINKNDKNEIEATGESEIKHINSDGKIGSGMIYHHKKCGTIVYEKHAEV